MVILPDDNEKDLKELPKTIRNSMEFRPVCHMDEVLRLALVLDNPDEFFKQIDAEGSCAADSDYESSEADRPSASEPSTVN